MVFANAEVYDMFVQSHFKYSIVEKKLEGGGLVYKKFLRDIGELVTSQESGQERRRTFTMMGVNTPTIEGHKIIQVKPIICAPPKVGRVGGGVVLFIPFFAVLGCVSSNFASPAVRRAENEDNQSKRHAHSSPSMCYLDALQLHTMKDYGEFAGLFRSLTFPGINVVYQLCASMDKRTDYYHSAMKVFISAFISDQMFCGILAFDAIVRILMCWGWTEGVSDVIGFDKSKLSPSVCTIWFPTLDDYNAVNQLIPLGQLANMCIKHLPEFKDIPSVYKKSVVQITQPMQPEIQMKGEDRADFLTRQAQGGTTSKKKKKPAEGAAAAAAGPPKVVIEAHSQLAREVCHPSACYLGSWCRSTVFSRAAFQTKRKRREGV